MKVKTDKRIQEIEQSLKLLAKYMKDEHARLEAEIERAGTKDIEEIKKKLEEQPHTEMLTTDIEKRLQQEVARLEGLIYSIPKEKLLKEYSEGMKVSDELKKSVDLRLQVIEGRIKNTAQDIISSKLEDFETLQERFKRLDERVSNAVSILENMKASKDDDHARRLEKRINERLEEIQEQMNKEDRQDSREYRKLLAEMEELREREKLFAKRDDLKDMKEISAGMEEMQNRMKHFQRKEDLTRMLNEVKGRFEEFETRLKRNDTRDFATKKDLEEMAGEFDGYKKSMEKKFGTEWSDIDKMKKSLEGEIKGIIQKEAADIKSLGDLRKMTDELMTLSQRISEMESSFDKRLAAVENTEGNDQDVMDVRSDVDDIDKRLVEMEMAIKDLKALETKTRKALEHIENFDRDTKAESMKFVTAQLAEFAKHVDKRLPSVVTREDFTRSMIEMNHKISTLETPDFTYVNRRMQALESKVNEIYSMLKAFSSSIPVVVE